MANKPLQSIKFPGLPDTYVVPQIDDTLSIKGRLADAKTVGDEIEGNLHSLVNKHIYTSSATIISFIPFEFKVGEKYTFKNTSPNGIAVGATTRETSTSTTATENITTGNIPAGASVEFTVGVNAHYLRIYLSGAGSCEIIKRGLIIEEIQTDIVGAKANINELKEFVNDNTTTTYTEVFTSMEEHTVAVPSNTFNGWATRYSHNGKVNAVAIYGNYISTDNNSIGVEARIYDGDFSTVLASADKTIDAGSQVVFFDLPNEVTLSDNYYIAIVAKTDNCKIKIAEANSAYTTADSTFKNKFTTSAGNAWSSTTTYCLDVSLFTSKKKISTGTNTLFVGSSEHCDYSDIQTAIDNANDSDSNPVTIKVESGIYSRFSMTDGSSGVRHISIIGEDRNNVIIKDDTGNYYTPSAEIKTNGVIENITFIQEATTGSYNPASNFNYCYAVHDDFSGARKTEYQNCTFISNAGPAVGIGLHENQLIAFRNCEFICKSDETFGSKGLGALFVHNSLAANTINQVLVVENCTMINVYGTHGIRLSKQTDDGSGCSYGVRNCGMFGNGQASGYNTLPLSYSYNNNVESFNAT